MSSKIRSTIALRLFLKFKEMVNILKKKRQILSDLEEALDPKLLTRLVKEAAMADGSQFRPRVIEFPGRLKILKEIQAEEVNGDERTSSPGSRDRQSVRLTASVGINMGIDLEMRQ